jgi:hypothetical protein
MNAVMKGAVTALAVACALTGCQSPTDTSCASPTSVTGSWRYAAIQDAPQRASISGTLVVASQSCRSFEGTLDVVEVSAGGSRRIAGAVSGALVDSTAGRFTVRLGADEREHLVRFGRDSLHGTWLQLSSTGTATGSFNGRRQDPR